MREFTDGTDSYVPLCKIQTNLCDLIKEIFSYINTVTGSSYLEVTGPNMHTFAYHFIYCSILARVEKHLYLRRIALHLTFDPIDECTYTGVRLYTYMHACIHTYIYTYIIFE
jgi:hypothetical protein